jgi:Mg2+-importing ATPase
VAAVSLALPYAGPLAAWMGFVPLPLPLLATCVAIVLAYVALTEAAKRAVEQRRLRRPSVPSRARRR